MSAPMVNRTEPIPGYTLHEQLGRGGFGEVWKCTAPGGMQKAIKFVYGELDGLGIDRGAERELKSLERVRLIRHPFILSLERYDIVDGRLVIVTELADRTLWERFCECREDGLLGIPRDELLCYLRDAAEALDFMNGQHQIQHLDIKPTNLFLVQTHVKVADFGMVKMFEGSRAKISGGVTPFYAAPETFDGWVSRHTDQYSLGIVYQELLTGVRPFTGNSAKQMLVQHLSVEPNLRPLMPKDRAIIRRALAKNPRERFPTCLALIEALDQAQHMSRPVRIAKPAATIQRRSSPPHTPGPTPALNQ